MSESAAHDSVRYEVDGAVAIVTLNRPKAMNSLTTPMKAALLETLDLAGSDMAVRAVILTGAGRGFCGGQDLREHAAALEAGQGADTVRLHYNPIVNAVVSMPKPIIAAVNGVAAGAGASLALACDLRVAAAGATMMMAFARVGFGPDTGSSWTLQRLVGNWDWSARWCPVRSWRGRHGGWPEGWRRAPPRPTRRSRRPSTSRQVTGCAKRSTGKQTSRSAWPGPPTILLRHRHSCARTHPRSRGIEHPDGRASGAIPPAPLARPRRDSLAPPQLPPARKAQCRKQEIQDPTNMIPSLPDS